MKNNNLQILNNFVIFETESGKVKKDMKFKFSSKIKFSLQRLNLGFIANIFLKLKKELHKFVGYAISLFSTLDQRKGNIEILMLHKVVTQPSNLSVYGEITVNELETIIKHYQYENYCFISIDEVYKMYHNKTKTKDKYVCITLDDGYLNNWSVAYPIFKKYNVPFCIYIITNFPNHKSFDWGNFIETLVYENNTIYIENLGGG